MDCAIDHMHLCATSIHKFHGRNREAHQTYRRRNYCTSREYDKIDKHEYDDNLSVLNIICIQIMIYFVNSYLSSEEKVYIYIIPTLKSKIPSPKEEKMN